MSFDKSFLSHFIVIGSGTIVNMLLGLLTTPIITRIVNPNEYGQLSIFNMYTNIAVMVLCIGLDQALVRFFYEKKETGFCFFRWRDRLLCHFLSVCSVSLF